MFAVVEINGARLPDPMMVAICPGKDLRLFGPFDTPALAATFMDENELPQEKYVILRLEWHL